MYDRQKITIVPLRSAEHDLLAVDESVDLGFGVTVERCGSLLSSSDLSIWSYRAAQHDEEEISSWDVCLVHRYQAMPITGEPEEASIKLMAYVLAHLRMINPHRDSIDDSVQLHQDSSGTAYSAFRCSKAATRPNRFLCDCENLGWGIDLADLNQLKSLMPWITAFASNWEKYYPLWISMYFFEQGYLPNNFRTAHLFRVMALEALFCSETSFGKKALTHRIPKFLGTGIDLYEPYHVEFLNLPRMELTVDLIKDVYTLRNKIAHSDALPEDW